MNDKVVLVLFFFRCFFYLWGINWFKDFWMVGNIYFFVWFDEIWNFYYFFIYCFFDNFLFIFLIQVMILFFFFVKFFFEIEIGICIDVDFFLVIQDEFEDIIVSIFDFRGDRFGRREYNVVVDGCFYIFVLVNKQSNEVGGVMDELDMMRKVIYDVIVELFE